MKNSANTVGQKIVITLVLCDTVHALAKTHSIRYDRSTIFIFNVCNKWKGIEIYNFI